jgi:hypothetical protein
VQEGIASVCSLPAIKLPSLKERSSEELVFNCGFSHWLWM